MIVKLPYADDRIALDLRRFRVRSFTPSAPPARNAAELTAHALDDPLAGPPLEEIARGRQTATVIVPDVTRKVSLPEVLPTVIERLRRAGVPENGIIILVANGTHPAVGEPALVSHLGTLAPSIRIIEHDSRTTDLVTVGELRPGLSVRLNSAAVNSECLITIGGVRHHYFAGFGGGPKMVFPGVGGYEEIQANHALVLDLDDREAQRNPRCEPGTVKDNPVAEEILQAARLRPPDLALCLVGGRDGGVAWAGAGPWDTAFDAAVERVRSWYEVPLAEPFELMIACAGGRPTDTTLIQAHKSLDAACRFMAPGGELLLVASLDGGLGSDDMKPFIEDPIPQAILDRLSKNWIQYGHTTLRILEKTAGFRVHLHTNLDTRVVERLGFEPLPDPERLLDEWRQHQPGAQVGVMAAGAVYPRTT